MKGERRFIPAAGVSELAVVCRQAPELGVDMGQLDAELVIVRRVEALTLEDSSTGLEGA